MLAWVPDQSPNDCRFIDYSPAIDYSKENTPKKGEASIWSWDPSEPSELLETHSNTVFPNKDFAVETRSVKNGMDQNVNVDFVIGKYPETANGVWLGGCLSKHQTHFLGKTALRQIARYYNPSKPSSEKYAERVIILLDAWATKWPQYVLKSGNTNMIISPADCASSERPFYDCRLHSTYNGYAHELDYVRYILEVLEKVRNSNSAADISKSRGYDVISHIEINILKREGDFVIKPRILDMIKGNLNGWISPLINIARVLDDPSYVSYVGEYVTAGKSNLDRDGLWHESFMYGQHGARGFNNAIADMETFFKDTGTMSDEEQRLLASVQALKAIFVRGHQNIYNVEQPNGQWPGNGDNNREGFMTRTSESGATEIRVVDNVWVEAERSSGAVLLPVYGHAALRSGAQMHLPK